MYMTIPPLESENPDSNISNTTTTTIINNNIITVTLKVNNLIYIENIQKYNLSPPFIFKCIPIYLDS